VDATVRALLASEGRYRAVAAASGMPWQVVAVVHSLEGGGRFDRHLHNGDPLAARTVHVPAGRPVAGSPPFTWEESAADALALSKLAAWTDWSLPGTLYRLEQYNGWGYRTHHPEVSTPYLWSFTSRYSRGKYAADGHFDGALVSQQCGAAALLLGLAAHGAGLPGAGAGASSARVSSSSSALLFLAAILAAVLVLDP
jgi:lysozyme family protein